jgi:type III secretory pathway component EscR
MVFILYKVYNTDIKFIAAYELEVDAQTDKQNMILDTPMEDQESYKYEIADIHYYKNETKKPMKYSEEDTNIDEEEYYNMVAKTKHQSEEIILLKEELTYVKNNYTYMVNELTNDSYIMFMIYITIVVLFSFLVITCLI